MSSLSMILSNWLVAIWGIHMLVRSKVHSLQLSCKFSLVGYIAKECQSVQFLFAILKLSKLETNFY